VDLDFDLPADGGFVSLPPLVPLDEFPKRCEEMARMFPEGISTAAERWARKVHIPFEI
jgi:hypothetical protein